MSKLKAGWEVLENFSVKSFAPSINKKDTLSSREITAQKLDIALRREHEAVC
jgi:hypothetical protein